jgi:hypothetical protein
MAARQSAQITFGQPYTLGGVRVTGSNGAELDATCGSPLWPTPARSLPLGGPCRRPRSTTCSSSSRRTNLRLTSFRPGLMECPAPY